MKRLVPSLLAIALAAVSMPAGGRQSALHYGVIAKYKVGGDGGWDYLTADPVGHRLYVSRGSHVMVISTDSGAVVGDIPDTNGVHGIAVDDRIGKGFTSNGRDNSVTVFDLKSLKVLGKIAVGRGPDGILYDKGLDRVITMNGQGGDITIINPASATVVGSVKLAGRPEAAVSDGKTLFVNIEDKSEIEHIDVKGLKSLGTWSLAPGEGPSGLAIDARHHKLFATCDGMFVVVDSNTGKVLGTPKLGGGPDAGDFDPRLGVAFGSCGDGTLGILSRDAGGNYTVSTSVPTVAGARTMALDTRTHRIYLSSAEYQPGSSGRRRPMVPGSFTIIVVGPTN
jgi:YVTN family beta-propeller protein